MLKWIRRYLRARKKKGKVFTKLADLGPCVIAWGKALIYGERPPIWATGNVRVNWTFVSVFEEHGNIELNFSESKYCFFMARSKMPEPLTEIAKRFNETHELRIESLYGHNREDDLLFFKTSLMLVDVARKVVKFKILASENGQVWQIGASARYAENKGEPQIEVCELKNQGEQNA